MCILTCTKITLFLVNYLPASQKLAERKEELKDGIVNEAVSWTLNNLGPVPDPATDSLYEPGIQFHLLQISFCMRTYSLAVSPMKVMRINFIVSLIYDTF